LAQELLEQASVPLKLPPSVLDKRHPLSGLQMTEPSMLSKCMAEFTGTFLLVFTIGCNVLSENSVWGGVSIACVLMVAIYAFGKISGANFNPAVSLALGLVNMLGGSGGLPWKTVGIYAGVQIFAGLLGGLAYELLFWDAVNLEPAKGFGFMSAATVEFVYTFMLCFVVLNVAAAKKAEPNEWYGLAIGFVIIAGAYGAGAVSGGCFNPAVAIGIDVSSAQLGFGWCLVYTVAELLGATLAAFLFKVVRPEEFREVQTKPYYSKLTSEFLGTYMLVFTVGLNVLGKSPAGAFSIAASLMCMIYALGDVSGANFNPAVTLAILCSGTGSMDAKEAVYYIVVQLAGGFWAAFDYMCVYHFKVFALEPQGKHGWAQVAAAEILFTFVLCFVVLCVAVSEKTKSKDFFGLAIGSCVTVGGFAIGAISGGSLNPAVSFGIAAASTFDKGAITPAIGYSVFELLGGIGAALLLRVTHADSTKKEADKLEAAA